jgi:hypothetical protein
MLTDAAPNQREENENYKTNLAKSFSSRSLTFEECVCGDACSVRAGDSFAPLHLTMAAPNGEGAYNRSEKPKTLTFDLRAIQSIL